MVSLQSIQGSNERIPAELPAKLVVVFAGGTSGIGEATMKRLAKLIKKPRFYYVGRSQQAGDRITEELQKINPDGEYVLIKSDVSLLKNVDAVCHQIKEKETAVNALFLSIGSLKMGTKTEEGLVSATALVYYARIRFIVNLLPLLQKADSLRRIVSVFAGTKEGSVNESDWQAEKAGFKGFRDQVASMVTMTMAKIQESAPDVSFVHDFPGMVKTGITRDLSGPLKVIAGLAFMFGSVSKPVSADFHVFLATSARFTSAKIDGFIPGVGIPPPIATGRAFFKGRGIEGKDGSGVYSVNETGQTSAPLVGGPDHGPPPKIERLMADWRKKGVIDHLWNHTQDEFKRITGTASI